METAGTYELVFRIFHTGFASCYDEFLRHDLDWVNLFLNLGFDEVFARRVQFGLGLFHLIPH